MSVNIADVLMNKDETIRMNCCFDYCLEGIICWPTVGQISCLKACHPVEFQSYMRVGTRSQNEETKEMLQ